VKYKPLISVIILAHNRPEYISRAVHSVISQTYENFELVLINNGSTDDTGKICLKLAAEDPRIRLIRRENSNIGAGRNAGIDTARGCYIAFIDDDDWAYPDFLFFLYQLAEKHRAEIAFCGSDKDVPDEGVKPQYVFDGPRVMTAEDAVIELLERRLLNAATPTKLFNAALFKNLRFREDRRYDDISLTYKLFATAGRIAAHGTPLYCFDRHGGNMSRFTDNDKTIFPAQLEEYFTVYRERTAWLVKKLPAIAEYIHYSEWSFLLSMYRKMVVHNLASCTAQRDYCEAYLRKAGDRFLSSPWMKDFEWGYWEIYQQEIKNK
jgi:glycosyltransferase involved in cell wall biosynthesis